MMCLLVVLSDQHLFLLCNAPDFLWGNHLPLLSAVSLETHPWSAKDHVTQSWEIRALDPTDEKISFGGGHMIQVWARGFVGTFGNPATVNSSNIY